MEDILLLEAVERYLAGEMSADEKIFFEELRKKDANIDQLVVEHTYFLQGLDKYGAIKSFKHALHEVESNLAEDGILDAPKLKGKALVVNFWNKY